jgi:CHAT domain-containing protein
LAQYAVLDDRLLIWLLSGRGMVVGEKRITRNELEAKVLDYLRLASSASSDDNEIRRRAAKELFDILISPIKSALDKNKALYLIPDKILNYLPYGALVSPESGKYLIEDYVLTMSPSSSVFINCTTRAKTQAIETTKERLLSVGNPAFDRQAFPELPNLPSARWEATEVAAYYNPAQILLESDATKERVIGAMEQANVVHLASHALVDERSPLHSKFVLAKGETTGRPAMDGMLQASEIYRLKLPRTRLVVLSACQTGVEQYYKGEGMIGLARPFIAAGAPLVVASLWPIDSTATAALMVNFHNYRKRAGLPTAAALRQAQLEMLDGDERRLRQPYYWASFVVIGGHTSF